MCFLLDYHQIENCNVVFGAKGASYNLFVFWKMISSSTRKLKYIFYNCCMAYYSNTYYRTRYSNTRY